MESTLKEKKSRDVGFENIKDPSVKAELMRLSKCPADATNFIFWYSKTNTNEWGLTIKSVPKKGDTEGFPSQHTWKITWFCKASPDGSAKLAIANHCKSLGSDIEYDAYQSVSRLYNSYRN